MSYVLYHNWMKWSWYPCILTYCFSHQETSPLYKIVWSELATGHNTLMYYFSLTIDLVNSLLMHISHHKITTWPSYRFDVWTVLCVLMSQAHHDKILWPHMLFCCVTCPCLLTSRRKFSSNLPAHAEMCLQWHLHIGCKQAFHFVCCMLKCLSVFTIWVVPMSDANTWFCVPNWCQEEGIPSLCYRKYINWECNFFLLWQVFYLLVSDLDYTGNKC